MMNTINQSNSLGSLLDESYINNTMVAIKRKITGKYFGNLTEPEFDKLLELIQKWYYENSNIEKMLTNPKYQSLMKKLEPQTTPRTLFRGLNFSSKKELDNALKDKNYSKGKNPLSSWTTSKSTAKEFCPGGKYDQRNKFGLLMEIPGKYTKGHIKFTLNGIFATENDRIEFFRIVIQRHIAHLENMMKTGNIKRMLNNHSVINKLQGSVYALTENEYVLNSLFSVKEHIKVTQINK